MNSTDGWKWDKQNNQLGGKHGGGRQSYSIDTCRFACDILSY